MQLLTLPILFMFLGSTIAGLKMLYPSINSAEPQDSVLDVQKQLSKEDFNVLLQLVSLVKRMGGVSALESLLINAARNNYRGPVLSDHRTSLSEGYGPTVTEVTVTSPPLALKKATAPLILTNFTINIQKLNIDPLSLREED